MKKGFLIFSAILLVFLTSLAILGEKFDDSHRAIWGPIYIFLLPGSIIYVITTGDIHGWQPGPIGQLGRVIVTVFGSWIFWTFLVFLAYKRWTRNRKR